ncbi:MAG: efflux RND transporter periplasmic adaptor subunit [Rhodanobacteraceae bacterium]|nr:efflux RND transporter periplasmic adaptor subunit [Rhodanobacteraceae bacterium]
MKTPALASFLLLSATCAALLLSGCASEAQSTVASQEAKAEKPKAEVIPVEVAMVTQGDITARYAGTATLEAEREAKVVSEIGGVVLSLEAEEGQFVRRGQVLAKLDAERQAVLLRQAETELERLKHQDARNESLFKRQLIARNMYEQNKSDVATRKAEVDLARLGLSKCAVVAPFDGVVTRRWVKQGQLLKVNEVAFEVADFRELKARLRVPERASAALKSGQTVNYEADALPGERFLAEVERVSPVVDAASGTVDIVVAVDNSTGKLRPGLFSRLDIAYDTVAAAILVPKTALLTGDRENSVFIVRENKAQRVAIKLGYESGNSVQVLQGLSPGTDVVVAGQAALIEGSEVQPLRAEDKVNTVAKR